MFQQIQQEEIIHLLYFSYNFISFHKIVLLSHSLCLVIVILDFYNSSRQRMCCIVLNPVTAVSLITAVIILCHPLDYSEYREQQQNYSLRVKPMLCRHTRTEATLSVDM